MGSRLTSPQIADFSASGPGAKLYAYAAGTSTPKNTYSDAGETTPNANPIEADANGRFGDIYLESGAYKFILKTSADVEIWTRDNVESLDSDVNELKRMGEDLVAVAGTADALTADFSNNVILAANVRIMVKANSANATTTPTLNVDGTGAKTIVREGGGAVVAGDIQSGHYLDLVYNGTQWELLNPYKSKSVSAGVIDVTNAAADLVAAYSAHDPLHISGLVPSQAADADHDITISTGSCRDSSDTENLDLTSAITKQIDAAWAAGNNAGGLFSGTVAADTTYHLFLIRKDSDGSIDAGFDTSITAANIPAGYTSYRRVISIVTDGSANIIGFTAVETDGGGVRVTLIDPILELSTSAPGTSGVLLTMSVPAGVQVVSRVFLYLNDSSSAVVYLSEVSQTDTAPATPHFTAVVSAGATIASTTIDLLTNTSSQIRYRSTVGSGLGGFQIVLHGWTDFRR